MDDMVEYDDWLDGVNTSIAGQAGSAVNVPRLIVVQVIRSVVREFLSESNIWIHTPIVQPFIDGSRDRLLNLPRDTYICKVWDGRCCSYLINNISYSHPNIINLAGLSEGEVKRETLKGLEVSLSMAQSSLECPRFIYDRYYDGILSGALAALQAMPGKAWTEPNMVAYHRERFEQAIRKAQSDLSKSFNRQKNKNTIPPNFI